MVSGFGVGFLNRYQIPGFLYASPSCALWKIYVQTNLNLETENKKEEK